MSWQSEKWLAPPALLAVWVVGLAAATALSVEGMFGQSHMVFFFARLTTYITTAMVAALTVGLAALFGIGCGLMLRWLEEATVSARQIARVVTLSFWPVAAYTWLGVVLLLVDPPAVVTLQDLLAPPGAAAPWQDVLAFEWLARLRYVVTGCSLALAAWLLSRHAKLLNAIIAVACGAALVAALMSLLGLLATAIGP